ncbi:MAG: hypothetical protein HYV09_24705 [Deltaproteobacteria bacterium]|nr:hypothetical protein [Deltaproteobacteria bacterium]
MTRTRRIALGRPLPTATAPGEFRIWPFGAIRTTKGTFLFDRASAESVIDCFRDYGNRLTIDYEHKAVDPSARAGDGKAAGSFSLELRDDGLWAVDVRWTPTAAAALGNKEWLYFSPYFTAEEDSGRILELVNLALTNIPATKGLTPLVAAHRGTTLMDEENTTATTEDASTECADEKTEKLRSARARAERLRAELAAVEEECAALSEQPGGDGSALTDEEATLSAEEVEADPEDEDEETRRQARRTSALSGPRRAPRTTSRIEAAARAATGKSDEAEIIGALTALSKTNASNVSLGRRIADLERKLRKTEVEALVTRAIKAGKLAPVEREWALSYGMDNPGKLRGYLDVTPARASVAGSEPVREPARAAVAPGELPTMAVALSDDERRICENTGIDPTRFAAVKHRAIRFGGG